MSMIWIIGLQINRMFFTLWDRWHHTLFNELNELPQYMFMKYNTNQTRCLHSVLCINTQMYKSFIIRFLPEHYLQMD